MLEHESIAVATAPVDWDKDGLWAQDTGMLLVSDAGPDVAQAGQVKDQWGNPVVLSVVDLEDHYFPISGAQVWKPRYDPVQVVCVDADTDILLKDGQRHRVNAGDALLRARDMGLHLMARQVFCRRYRILTDAPELTALPDALT